MSDSILKELQRMIEHIDQVMELGPDTLSNYMYKRLGQQYGSGTFDPKKQDTSKSAQYKWKKHQQGIQRAEKGLKRHQDSATANKIKKLAAWYDLTFDQAKGLLFDLEQVGISDPTSDQAKRHADARRAGKTLVYKKNFKY